MTFTTKKTYKVSVPGSSMLFGEHAVLHGKLALACAIEQRIIVELTPRTDNVIQIDSQSYGKLKLPLKDLQQNHTIKIFPKWRFVLASILEYGKKLKQGFTLKITSESNEAIGFGSSATVTVATLAVLHLWLDKKQAAPLSLLQKARQVIQKVQGGIGSATDAAASIFGGIIAYQMQPMKVEKIANQLPLTIIYSGSKIPTPEVIAKVETLAARQKNIFAKLYEVMQQCTLSAKQAILHRHYRKLGILMNIHQGLQDALGVNNQTLAEIIFTLRQEPKIYGAKISGSGLGDCVIGLGKITSKNFLSEIKNNSGVKQIMVGTTSKGLIYN